MRVAILSGGNGWHVRDLQRAALQLGYESAALDFRNVCAGPGSRLGPLEGFDAVLVRTMPAGSLEQVIFRMDVLQRLQARGVRVVNSPRAVEVCVDKYLTTALLAAAGLPVPRTIVCQNTEASLTAFSQLGGDVLVKPLFGSEGRGMMRISDSELAWRTFNSLERVGSVLYLQEFVPHPGWDLRAFVIEDRVLAAMRRSSSTGWRTNVAQGGKAIACRLSPEEEDMALRAARCVEAKMAGVDLLRGSSGKLFALEVNAVPGWRALSRVTGIDVATMILKSL